MIAFSNLSMTGADFGSQVVGEQALCEHPRLAHPGHPAHRTSAATSAAPCLALRLGAEVCSLTTVTDEGVRQALLYHLAANCRTVVTAGSVSIWSWSEVEAWARATGRL